MELLHVFTDGQKEFYVQHCVMFAQIQFTMTQAIIFTKKLMFFPQKLCLFVVSTNTKWSY